MSTIERYVDLCTGILDESLVCSHGKVTMPDGQSEGLIVDDEVSIRTSLSQLFSALGYCVRSAADGRSALSEIRREIPEILLSDLNMPGMSGFEFLPMVRSQLPAIHVIAMSGAFSGACVPLGLSPTPSLRKARIRHS